MNLHWKVNSKFKFRRKEISPFRGSVNSDRSHLAELFFELGYRVGAEVGVSRGDFSEVLYKCNPDLKLYCIDPWITYGNISQRKQDRCLDMAQQRLAPYNAEFIRKTSMEALSDIPDGSLDFVYIDGHHDFNYVMLDIIRWSDKVRSGGIVSGHDYVHLRGVGVVLAVDSYVAANNLTWYLTRDHLPSFFWFKS